MIPNAHGQQNVINFFGGSPLNRLSWLRPSHAFLNAVIVSTSTRWILFNGAQPLVSSHPSTPNRISLSYLSTNDIKHLLGPEPFFGQGQVEGQLSAEAAPKESASSLEAARHRGPLIVFLGLKELNPDTAGALPSSDFKDPHVAVANLEGTPFFSLDVTSMSEGQVEELTKSCAKDDEVLSWGEPRISMAAFDDLGAGIFAEARSLLDWNSRTKFCAGCGSPTYSIWGGWKLSCSTLLPWADNTGRKPCPTAKGLHNFTHPRTDPVVIMLAIDESGDKALLGRNKKFPGKFYSALAGFIEPAEAFEDAVQREMWEEAGVRVWDIRYHSGQPWPYPANLMVGFYATADSSKPIRIDLDNELEDAQWYTRAQVLSILRHPTGTYFSSRDQKVLQARQDGSDIETRNVTKDVPSAWTEGEPNADVRTQMSQPPAVKEEVAGTELGEPAFRLPPLTAIAGVLIRDWAEGRVQFGTGKTQKGNL